MSEPLPAWKITPPLDPPGAPFHIWREGDQTWGEAHADWDATGATPKAQPLIFINERDRHDIAVLDAAEAARPALTEILRLWPFPHVDIEPVRRLVDALSKFDNRQQ